MSILLTFVRLDYMRLFFYYKLQKANVSILEKKANPDGVLFELGI